MAGPIQPNAEPAADGPARLVVARDANEVATRAALDRHDIGDDGILAERRSRDRPS